MSHRLSRAPVLALMVTLVLSACGGGGDSGGTAGGTTGGSLTLSSASPAANNTTLDVSKATTTGNDARAADFFSASPYCDIYFEGVPGANGTTYAVQVYVRQSDKAVLNASVVGGLPPTYAIFDSKSGSPISGVTVDATARTITFTNKAMTGSSGEAGTLNGTVTFPANKTVPACG